jgi:glycosyltransferase involved in cell wall biosynthesis
MNIAYISADFGVPILGCKGASIHVREMAAGFCSAGHAVVVISPAIENSEKAIGRNGHEENFVSSPLCPLTPAPFISGSVSGVVAAGVTLFPVHPPQEHHFQLFQDFEKLGQFLGVKTRLRQDLRNLFYNLALYEKARDYLLLSNADFIYERYTLFNFAGIRLARDLGVPHILEVNAPLVYEQEKMRGLETKELAAAVERRIFCETDRVIVVSRYLQAYVASCGVPHSRIHVLPNGVNPQRFTLLHEENGGSVRSLYQLEGKCVIGFVGSLKPWHGTETLLKAFRELHAGAPHAHLLIVGDGPGREALETYVQRRGLGNAVTFTGEVPYDYIPHYIAAMDITVAPYIPNETFYFSPIKIFEYMAMRKPVVAAGIGQVEEIISNGRTGVLFEPGNTDQLAAALTKLARDPQLRRHLGEKANAWVQKERTWENNARQVIAIARELVEKHRVFSDKPCCISSLPDSHSTSLAASLA